MQMGSKFWPVPSQFKTYHEVEVSKPGECFAISYLLKKQCDLVQIIDGVQNNLFFQVHQARGKFISFFQPFWLSVAWRT